jgi:hypothetical protein
MEEKKTKVVYRFLRKVDGEWKLIMDKNGIPISITTDKPQSNVLYLFRHRYPTIASMYRLGETLVEVPDVDATKRIAEVGKQRQEELDASVQDAWWQK